MADEIRLAPIETIVNLDDLYRAARISSRRHPIR
jgi:hypothetical protein